MMRYLIVMGLVCLGSVAWAQAAKQPAPPKGASSAAQVSADPQATSATYGDWVLVCQRLGEAPQQTCEVAQRIQVQGQPAPIAQLALARDGASQKLRLVVVLPNNIQIPTAPKVADRDTGGHEVTLAWHRCIPGGCFADAILADDVVKAWRSSTERGRIAYKDGLGRDIAVPLSFRGLSPALDALLKRN